MASREAENNMADATAPSLELAQLERIEHRFETALRELRQYRAFLQRDAADRGILGSRGLTRFCIEQLSQQPMSVRELLAVAERAGYQTPTARILSKRLNGHAYRTGMIAWDTGMGKWRAATGGGVE
jgi:hypothetical protein